MKRLERYFPLFAVAAVSLVGFTVLLLSTRWGVGLSPDSAIYIGAARSLLRGSGLSVPSWGGERDPLVHYPPLYSLLLACTALFGMDPLDGARWLNAALFGANIFLAGFCLYIFTRSFYLSLSASFLMLVSLPTVLVHSVAWSEPVFIFFGILGIHLLAAHVERANGRVLVASSVAFAFALLARYAGIAFVATGLVAAMFLAREQWRKRWIHTVTFASVSCLPLALLVAGNLMLGGTATGRKIAYHPLGREHWEALLGTVSTWLFPVRDPPFARWLNILAVAGLGLLFLVIVRRGTQPVRKGLSGPGVLAALLGLFMLSYGSLLAVSISLLDAQTPLDNRILSPLYVAMVLFFLCLLPALVSERGPRELPLFPILLGTLFVVFSGSQMARSASWLGRSYEVGLGYASREWNQSELTKYAKALDAGRPIFTNGPDIVYLLTGHPAYMIPRRTDPGTGLLNKNYADELASMKRILQEKGGVAVYFRRVTWRWYLASEDEMRQALNLNPIVETEDGAVYR